MHTWQSSHQKKTSPSLCPVFARHWWVYKYVGFSNFCCLRKWLISHVQFHDQLSWSKQLPQPSQYGPALGPLLSTLRGHFCCGFFPPASEVPHFVFWNMGAVRTWPQNATSWSTWEKLFIFHNVKIYQKINASTIKHIKTHPIWDSNDDIQLFLASLMQQRRFSITCQGLRARPAAAPVVRGFLGKLT